MDFETIEEQADAIEVPTSHAAPLPKNFRKEIDKARKERSGEVFLWDLTLRFLAGDQNMDFDWERKTFVTSSNRDGRNQLSEDQLRPIWNALSNALSVEYPAVAVSPSAPVADDLTKSLACEQLGRYHWHTNQMQYKYRDLVEYLLGGGTSAFHTFWDDDKERLVTEVVRAYDLLAESGATKDEEATWRACRKTYKRSVLMKVPAYKKYRTMIAEAPAADRECYAGARTTPKSSDRIDLWDVYFDDGGHGILCDDTWIFEGSYVPGEAPLIFVRYNKIDGKFWGQSVMVLLLDLQRELNHVNNLILDMMDSNSNMVWMVPFSANVSCRNLNNPPDGVVGYEGGGGEPKRLPPPPLSPSLFEVRRQIIQAMQDLAGVHNTTLGKRSVGITSKVLADKMVQQDASQLQGTMDDIERATHTLMTTVLSMYKRKLTRPLTMRMLDKGLGRVIHQELQATSILDQPEVEIGVGSLFRMELQDRNDQIMDMVDRKLMDPKVATKMLTLHMGNQDAMKKMVAYHNAQDKLEACKAGAKIDIFPYEDVDAIIEVFNEYIESPDYYKSAVALKLEYDRTEGADPNIIIEHDRQVNRMNYIRDVLVSCMLPLDATPDQIAKAMQSRVFPRATPDEDKSGEVALSATSPDAAIQSAEESAQLQQRKELINATDPASNADSIGPVMGGTGG
jgi:hypothetical protein